MTTAIVSGGKSDNRISLLTNNTFIELHHIAKDDLGLFEIKVHSADPSKDMTKEQIKAAVLCIEPTVKLSGEKDQLQVRLPAVQGLYKFGEVRFTVDKHNNEILLLPNTYMGFK